MKLSPQLGPIVLASFFTACLVCVANASAAAPRTAPPAGLRENTPTVHALVGSRIVVSPEQVIEKGTLVVRDGVIVTVDASDDLYFLRADRIAREFGLQAIVRGSGDEYRRMQAVAATHRAVIVPLDFPRPPKVSPPEAAMNVTLERLMHWDLAPDNPARLAEAGVKIAFTTYGLRDSGTFLSALRKAVKRGLKAEAALPDRRTGRISVAVPRRVFHGRHEDVRLDPASQASQERRGRRRHEDLEDHIFRRPSTPP